MKLETETKGIAALVTLSLGFGVIAIFGRYLGNFSFTPLQQLYLALGIGFIFSLFIFKKTLTSAKIKRIPKKDWAILLLRVIVGYLLAGSLYRQSLILAKISNVSFIQAMPVGAVFGFWLFRENLTLRKILLIAAAYLGVTLISVKDYSWVLTIGRGELLSFVSTILFTLSYISRKWQTDFLSDAETAQILLGVGFIILLAASIVMGESLPSVAWGTNILAALLVTGVLNAVNIFLINFGYKRVEAVVASNIVTLEAIFALVLAFIFFHEWPSVRELSGGILILVSVIGMNQQQSS